MNTQNVRREGRRTSTDLFEVRTGDSPEQRLEGFGPLLLAGIWGIGEEAVAPRADSLSLSYQEFVTNWAPQVEESLPGVMSKSNWLTDFMDRVNQRTQDLLEEHGPGHGAILVGDARVSDFRMGAPWRGPDYRQGTRTNLIGERVDARQSAIRASLQVLRAIGRNAVADRIADLERFRRQERKDGSSDELLAVESLMSAILFLLTGPQLPEPQVTMTGDGTLFFDWPIVQTGKIILLFRRDARITYVIKGPRHETSEKRYRSRGTDCQEGVVKAIRSISHWLPGA